MNAPLTLDDFKRALGDCCLVSHELQEYRLAAISKVVAHDAALRQRVLELEKEWDSDVEDLVSRCACQWDRSKDGEAKADPIVECGYHLKVKAQLAAVTKERDELKQSLEQEECRNIDIAKLQAQLQKVEGALKAIAEHWNGNYNTTAMTDYCNMARETSEKALAALGEVGHE